MRIVCVYRESKSGYHLRTLCFRYLLCCPCFPCHLHQALIPKSLHSAVAHVIIISKPVIDTKFPILGSSHFYSWGMELSPVSPMAPVSPVAPVLPVEPIQHNVNPNHPLSVSLCQCHNKISVYGQEKRLGMDDAIAICSQSKKIKAAKYAPDSPVMPVDPVLPVPPVPPASIPLITT